MTYEGNGNHYWDTTFNLRVPFRPNSNGQYKVQINEAAIKNNEATLNANEDYYEFKIFVSGDPQPRTLRFTCNADIYTYRLRSILSILNLLDSTNASWKALNFTPGGNWMINVGSDPDDPSSYISIVYNMANPISEEISGAFNVSIGFPASSGLDIDDVYRVEMSYSNNWAYILNNMNLSWAGTKNGDSFVFTFYNLRLNGPYMYILDTPLTATSPTYNANNQGYNIVALTYNTSQVHNSVIQMCSSMECVTNDLSNFRLRLLNDQYDPVHILEPLYVQISISNEG